MSHSDIHYSTVDRDIVDLLLEQNPQASPVELANLWGDIGFWSGQKKRRWSKSAYHLTYGTNQRTLARYLNELVLLGAVTADPANRKTLPPPWKAHETGTGGDVGDVNLSSLSISISNSKSISISNSESNNKKTAKQSRNTGNKEQIQKLLDTWNLHKPAGWTHLKQWNPKRQKVVDDLYAGQGGTTQFIADIPTVFAGLQFIGKKTPTSRSYWLDPDHQQHHNFDTFMGTGQKLPKTNWAKALEAAPSTCSTSDKADSLKGDPWKDHGIRHAKYAPPTPLNEMDPELPLGLRSGTHDEQDEADARRYYSFPQKQKYLEQTNGTD